MLIKGGRGGGGVGGSANQNSSTNHQAQTLIECVENKYYFLCQ